MTQNSDTARSPNGAKGHHPERLLYPIPETQEILGGISRSHLYELIKRGDLEVVKMGKRSFITDEAIRKLVAQLPRRGGP